MEAEKMFKKLGFKKEKECYEHPLLYNKKRKNIGIYDVEDDSFAFYKKEKVLTIWKDGKVIILTLQELKAIMKQFEELKN